MRFSKIIMYLLIFAVLLPTGCAQIDLIQQDSIPDDTEMILTALPDEMNSTILSEDESTNTHSGTEISENNIQRLAVVAQSALPGAIKAGWNLSNSALNVITVRQSFQLHYPELSTLSTTSWQEDVIIYDLASDGSLIALSNDMQTIELFDINSAQTVNVIVPDTMVNSASFSPDNTNLLVTSLDEIAATEYSVSSGEIQNTFRGFEFAGPVYDAFYAPLTNDIIWYSRGSVQVQNRQTNELSPFFSHEDFANSIALTPDGNTFAVSTAMTVDEDFSPGIQLWNRATGESIGFIQTSQLVKDLAFTLDGTALLGSEGIYLKAWSMKSLNEIASFSGHNDTISFVSLSPDGAHILTGSFDNSIILWGLTP